MVYITKPLPEKCKECIIARLDNQLFADNKRLKEVLKQYGTHLKDCELVRQPFLCSTEGHWVCTCGYSKAVNCETCEGTGYLVGKEVMNSFHTGCCFDCF